MTRTSAFFARRSTNGFQAGSSRAPASASLISSTGTSFSPHKFSGAALRAQGTCPSRPQSPTPQRRSESQNPRQGRSPACHPSSPPFPCLTARPRANDRDRPVTTNPSAHKASFYESQLCNTPLPPHCRRSRRMHNDEARRPFLHLHLPAQSRPGPNSPSKFMWSRKTEPFRCPSPVPVR